MKQSVYYFKKLTPAEIGNTGAHLIYIRLANDFDYRSFWGEKLIDRGNLLDANFVAKNLTEGHENDPLVDLRFVHYNSGARENRIPNLGTLFENNKVKEGDIVCLEKRYENDIPSYYITFRPNVTFPDLNKKENKRLSFAFKDSLEGNNRSFISALRTKPFLLLAGISGTGKSRKVLELSYLTCKRDGIHDQDETSPGNYLLIPVKPNWHDSTELLGYYSSITGKYILTDFIRFVWKASIHKDVPYFLCLDEMNLAPVEQYFAEYLSILETRKKVYNEQTGEYIIQTAEILPKKQFEGIKIYTEVEKKDSLGDDDVRIDNVPLYKGEDVQIINFLKENGLRLPDNLFVIGTVNMDDTTHQFSRKVIDRAFTIEMNGGDLEKMFDSQETLIYQDDPLTLDEIRPHFVQTQEVLVALSDDSETIKKHVPEMLNKINSVGIFKDTPFRVSYRVQNELVLYYSAIRPQGELNEEQVKSYLQEAFMAILLEKILPRVEGDEKTLKCREDGYSEILNNLKDYICEMYPEEEARNALCNALIAKIDEMNERVKNSYFTSFFS